MKLCQVILPLEMLFSHFDAIYSQVWSMLYLASHMHAEYIEAQRTL